MVFSYLKYLVQRKSEYSIHSPFVYEFMRKVLNDSGSNRDYDTIYRLTRLLDKKKYINYNLRKQSRLLYRMVRYFEPDSVVSFGHMSALNATVTCRPRSFWSSRRVSWKRSIRWGSSM